jgi:hypothetical protein
MRRRAGEWAIAQAPPGPFLGREGRPRSRCWPTRDRRWRDTDCEGSAGEQCAPRCLGPTADAEQAGLDCVMERIWSVATKRIRNREHRQAAGKALRDKCARLVHGKVLLGHGDTRDLIALINASTEGPVEALLPVRHGRPRERANPGSSHRQEFAERSRVRRTHAATAEQLRNLAVDRLGASVRWAQKGTRPRPQRCVVAAVHACCG